MNSSDVLVFSPRFNTTAVAIGAAAHERGIRTESLSDWRVPEYLRGHQSAHLYAGPLFADAISDALGLALLEPPADWLSSLPVEVTGREIVTTTIAEARELRRPAFIKPPNDKSFPARVYTDGSRLPGPDAVDDDLRVLVSDVVTFRREYRLFVLDGRVHSGSLYFREGELCLEALTGSRDDAAVSGFATDFLSAFAHTLPSAVVVDIGMMALEGGGERPCVIEANMAWASGHYACDAGRVLDVVLRAAFNRSLLTEQDARFARASTTVTG